MARIRGAAFPRKSHIRRGWDFSKWPLFIAAAAQIVSMRGQLIDQEQKNATTASALVAMQRDISRLSGTVYGKKLEPRISRLESPRRAHAKTDETARPVQVARPGLIYKVARVPAATWGLIKRMFQGRDANESRSPSGTP